MSLSARRTHLPVLSGTERFSVQPVAISVTVSVNAWGPAGLPPSWQTGRPRQTRVGRRPSRPRYAPGLTFEQRSRLGSAAPLELILGSLPARRRSMVAADIDTNSAAAPHRCPAPRNGATLPPVRPARRQPLAGRHAQHRPAGRQRGMTSARTRWPRTSRGDDLGLQRRRERLRHGYGASRCWHTTRRGSWSARLLQR